MAKRKEFTPVRAIVLDAINSKGKESSRVFCHPNAAPVWEKNFKA